MTRVPKPKLLVAMLASLALSACGGEESSPAVGGGSGSASGASTDLAFATQMAEHHDDAIEMAGLAPERADHPEIEALAEDIVTSQEREVGLLERVSRRLEEAGTEAGDLGLSEEMSGMGHDAAALEGAEPFDQAFIDAMVPHHQGAIRMARVELDKGADGELKALAEDIVEAQSREIEQMNEWRTDWYGEPSPAGGVPAGEGSSEEEGHSSH